MSVMDAQNQQIQLIKIMLDILATEIQSILKEQQDTTTPKIVTYMDQFLECSKISKDLSNQISQLSKSCGLDAINQFLSEKIAEKDKQSPTSTTKGQRLVNIIFEPTDLPKHHNQTAEMLEQDAQLDYTENTNQEY